jgi:heat-inducible transcriptional repressor
MLGLDVGRSAVLNFGRVEWILAASKLGLAAAGPLRDDSASELRQSLKGSMHDQRLYRSPGPLGAKLDGTGGPAGAPSNGPLILKRAPALEKLDDRTRAIFKQIVETYLATGEPVGSRNLSRGLPIALSPASIRNVMSDLEHLGLVYAPHTSAGRLPTETGLRLFVDGILEVSKLSDTERSALENQFRAKNNPSPDGVLAEATEVMSGLARCAGVVLSDRHVNRLKHVEFVNLEPGRALVVLVGEDNRVENRVITIPVGVLPSALVEAANYLNTHIRGLTLAEARGRIETELASERKELDQLTQKVVREGLATWSGTIDDKKSLIVRGQSHLLDDVGAIEDLQRIRSLFEDLETKSELIRLLGSAEKGDGVSIFIGSESNLFSLTGSSLIVAPFKDAEHKIVGVLGVIGPTRLNYARIIPVVDYTAQLVGRLLT